MDDDVLVGQDIEVGKFSVVYDEPGWHICHSDYHSLWYAASHAERWSLSDTNNVFGVVKGRTIVELWRNGQKKDVNIPYTGKGYSHCK